MDAEPRIPYEQRPIVGFTEDGQPIYGTCPACAHGTTEHATYCAARDA